VRGINDPWELSQAAQIMNQRKLKDLSLKGVCFKDTHSTWVDPSVEIEEDVQIYPGCVLEGSTAIKKGSRLGPNVFIKNSKIGEGVLIKAGSVIEDSVVDARATIGPYAHLRPESRVGERAKIGNFVELKKTKIGPETSVAHLSYLGDAEVGARVNIGCGFVTCNFDGREIDGQRKHKTVIEDEVFMGSDCQTIAPIHVGKGSYVASGSTVTEDVPSDALAIARPKQVNKLGYGKKIRDASAKGSSGKSKNSSTDVEKV
jgi:bifunctional UDP-N-acetylglucosamine pyrophosphorylase/glucosamine-1-phosphate N-acetyltransferase